MIGRIGAMRLDEEKPASLKYDRAAAR